MQNNEKIRRFGKPVVTRPGKTRIAANLDAVAKLFATTTQSIVQDGIDMRFSNNAVAQIAAGMQTK